MVVLAGGLTDRTYEYMQMLLVADDTMALVYDPTSLAYVKTNALTSMLSRGVAFTGTF